MPDGIKRFFTAPVFEDEEKTRRARMTSTMLHVIFFSVLLAGLLLFTLSPVEMLSSSFTLGAMGLALVAALGLRQVLWRGHVRLVSALLIALFFIVVTFALYTFGGVSNVSATGYLLCIIIASLLLGARAAIITLVLSIVMLVAVWYAGEIGLVLPLEDAPLFDLVVNIAVFVMGGLLLRYAVASLDEALTRARQNERAQREANRELQALRESLEQQVAERTQALERHTAYLEATTQTSRVVTSILDVELLIDRVTALIQERFGLYHVALFLLDSSGQWAQFRAGTGEVGRLLRAEGFRLPIDENSMVGWCVKHMQPCVAQDVQQFSPRVDHPLLHETRSEVALPLIARGRVLGALNAQSSQLGAFDAGIVVVLQTLADQVAVALDNARLFAEAQAALEAEQRAYRQMSREAWAEVVRAQLLAGYRYINQQAVPIFKGDVTLVASADGTLTLPIKVRGAVIGQVSFQREPAERRWNTTEIAVLQTLIEQLGLALESARLYLDTQQRAAQERLIGEITTRIRESLDMEWVLQVAARELAETLGASRVNVRLLEPTTAREGGA